MRCAGDGDIIADGASAGQPYALAAMEGMRVDAVGVGKAVDEHH